MILGEGYSLWADIWTIGILTFELFTGKVPFGNKTDNPVEISRSILEE